MDIRTRITLEGVAWGFAFTALAILAVGILQPDPKPEDRFKVVDTYKNCNVIRYTDPSNQWHYFLRCST